MGQLGFSEMIVIFIVALLVFGPKKLPELGKSLGKGIREFRRATDELKSTWADQVKDIKAPLDDVKKDLNEMHHGLKTDLYKSLESSVEAEPAETLAPETHQPSEAHQSPETHTASQPNESAVAVPKEHV